ncbi:Gamma-tubulin complex component 5 [Branchiostoma belcheri]|nr:Gamma-tubulin complex component 5 [Branchiostoma belcheri]
MFNNSSLLPSGTGETSGDFNSKSSCILWHLQNNSSYNHDRAQEACSMYTDFPELGTGMTVAFWLTGIHILISNAAVLWGIIRTPAELRKQLHILMANLAVADLLAVTVFLLLICVMVFANVSVFLAIKERQKRRLGQPGGQNDPGQNSASQDQPNDAAERKYQKSVQKTRTVLIQVVSAIIFWLVPMIFILSCKAWEKCPLPTRNTGIPLVAPLLLVLNSAINPVASIIRTPDLRTSLRQDAAAIYQALVTMIRGNRVNPQDEQTPPNQRGGTGAASRSERNMPTGQSATGPEVTRSNQGIADSLEIVELV